MQAIEEEKARKAAAAAQVKGITKAKKRQDGRVQYKVKYRNGSSELLDEEHERIQPRHVASFTKRRAKCDLDKGQPARWWAISDEWMNVPAPLMAAVFFTCCIIYM